MSAGRVLVVCPSPGAGDRLAEILNSDGWEVYRAGGHRDALDQVNRFEIDVVICEAGLWDGTWRDVLRGLDSVEGAPRLIVASMWADERLWAEALNLGAYDVLVEPFDRQEVTRVAAGACRAGLAHCRC